MPTAGKSVRQHNASGAGRVRRHTRRSGLMRKAAVRMAAGVVAVMALGLAGCSDPSENLDASDRDVCREALRECAREGGGAEVVERVAAVIPHDDTVLAAEAVRTLGRIQTARAVEILGEVASGAREKRAAIRQEAVVQLGRQEGPEVLEVLRKVVKVDPDPRVRIAAVTSLGWKQSLKDVPLLVEVAENETDPVVQARAVGAIERLVSLKFGFDPSAPLEERQKALQRLRPTALTAARKVSEWREKRRQGRQ